MSLTDFKPNVIVRAKFTPATMPAATQYGCDEHGIGVPFWAIGNAAEFIFDPERTHEAMLAEFPGETDKWLRVKDEFGHCTWNVPAKYFDIIQEISSDAASTLPDADSAS